MACTNWALMPTLMAPGEKQMELDLWMLDQLEQNEAIGAYLRLYQWESTCISIGRHQAIPNKTNALAVVRRPTGGGCVLHGADLCYTVAVAKPPRGNRLSYQCLNQWLSRALKQLGAPLSQGYQKQINIEGHCFARATAADLVDQSGNKRIGSAQLWRKGNLLQQGSIQLQIQSHLWHELFNEAPPPPLTTATGTVFISSAALETVLIDSAKDWLFSSQPLLLPWPEAALTSGKAATLSAMGASDNPKG